MGSRIGTQHMTYQFLNSLNKTMAKQSELTEKMTDGLDLHRPSDDPIRVVRSLRFRSTQSELEKFDQNANDAISWLTSTDSTLQNMTSLLTRVKELTIQATAPNPESSIAAIGEEINGIIDNMVETANIKVGNRFLFSGQADATQPFVRQEDGSVVFQGDNNYISLKLQAGAASPGQDSVNTTAAEAFGPDLEVFNQLNILQKELRSGSPDLAWVSNVGLASVDSAQDRVIAANTKVGTRISTYEMMQNIIGDNSNRVYEDLAKNDDLDMAKATIDMKSSELLYRASLSIGSKIMPTSLLDFLN